MKEWRVVRLRGDAASGEVPSHAVFVLNQYRERSIYVRYVWILVWQHHGQAVKELTITPGNAPPARDAIIEQRQLCRKDGSVQAVQSLVEALGDEPPQTDPRDQPFLVVHAKIVSVVAEHFDPRGNIVVVGGNDARITCGAQDFRRR